MNLLINGYALSLLVVLLAGCASTGIERSSTSKDGSLLFSFETVRSLDDTALCVVQGLNQAWVSAGGQQHRVEKVAAGREYEIRPSQAGGPDAGKWVAKLTVTSPQTTKVDVFTKQPLSDDTQNRLLTGTDLCKE